MLRIGISARFMARSTDAFGMGGKAVQYLEQNMANALAREGGLVFLIPSIGTTTELSSEHFHPCAYAKELDALVLQGGVDISPEMYGEKPTSFCRETDPVRDRYEMKLIESFLKLKKPVLGICRGMQLINVYLGGSLHQDIPSEIKSPVTHLCEKNREQIEHAIEILPGSSLAEIFGTGSKHVNSIHHQCVKALGRGLKKEAVCPEDGIIEAIRFEGDSYLMGVQWHPEFNAGAGNLNSSLLFQDFMAHARHRRENPIQAVPARGIAS